MTPVWDNLVSFNDCTKKVIKRILGTRTTGYRKLSIRLSACGKEEVITAH